MSQPSQALPLQKMVDIERINRINDDLQSQISNVKHDVSQLTNSKRRSSLLGGGEASISGQDGPIVERLFTASKNGSVFLQSSCLTPAAVASLKNPGQSFSVAGKIELKHKITDQGSCVMIEFTVPSSKAAQYKQHSAATGTLDFLPEPVSFNPKLFCTLLSVEDAERMLMTMSAPMWPSINC